VNAMLVVRDTVWIGTIEFIQIRNVKDGELIKEIIFPGYNLVLVGKYVWTCLYSKNTGQIKLINIDVSF
jgi:hypothetical protein